MEPSLEPYWANFTKIYSMPTLFPLIFAIQRIELPGLGSNSSIFFGEYRFGCVFLAGTSQRVHHGKISLTKKWFFFKSPSSASLSAAPPPPPLVLDVDVVVVVVVVDVVVVVVVVLALLSVDDVIVGVDVAAPQFLLEPPASANDRTQRAEDSGQSATATSLIELTPTVSLFLSFFLSRFITRGANGLRFSLACSFLFISLFCLFLFVFFLLHAASASAAASGRRRRP